MVKKRWYDNEATMSMAVSLLQNASTVDQLRTCEYVFQLLEEDGLLEKHNVGPTLTAGYLLPFIRRESMNQDAWRLLEVMKQLPQDVQLEMALNMIQYIYKLDSGMDLTDSGALGAQIQSG